MKNGFEKAQTALSSNRSRADRSLIPVSLPADATVAIGLGMVAQTT